MTAATNTTRAEAVDLSLPVEINGATRADFERLGFLFGADVAGDPLFCRAKIPADWTLESSPRSLWSYLLDGRGIRMVAIYYKAGDRERRADMQLTNPGQDAALAYVYGDEAEPIHPAFTIDELDQMRIFAEGYLDDAKKYPEIYDAGDRAKKLIQRLDLHATKNRRPRSVR